MGGLNPRERQLVFAAGFMLVAVVVYVFFLEPGYRRLEMLRGQVPALQEDLVWMRSQVEVHRDLTGAVGADAAPRPPLLTVIEQTANQAGLRQQISRMAPAEEGRVRVWFDDVYFDPWLRWLESIRRQRVSVFAVNIVRDKQGKVDIRLTVAG